MSPFMQICIGLLLIVCSLFVAVHTAWVFQSMLIEGRLNDIESFEANPGKHDNPFDPGITYQEIPFEEDFSDEYF